MPTSYRWVILGVSVFAQAASAAVLQGLPALAPQLREEYGLGLTGIGVLLGAVTTGVLLTLFLWGVLADRFGGRRVITVGLLLTVAALLATTRTATVVPLVVLLGLAGAAGASVNAATGRAVVGWFGVRERGVAMGVRQTGFPLGAGLAAAALPPFALVFGVDGAFLVLAAGCAVAAAASALLVREAPAQPPRVEGGRPPVRDARIRRLSLVSLLLVVPQFAVVAFLVVYLVDEHGFAPARAALLLAVVQLGGGASRIVAGLVSDRLGLRLAPVRVVALTISALFLLAAALEAYDVGAVVPLLVLTGVVALSWNGLAFTAAGELAGPGRAGSAIGLLNTALALGAAVTAPVLGAVVDRTAWSFGFALLAVPAAGAFVLLRGPSRAEAREELQEPVAA